MQVLGVVTAALVLAPVLRVLHGGPRAASRARTSPRRVAVRSIAEGFTGGAALPWDMVGLGAGLGAPSSRSIACSLPAGPPSACT